MGFSNSGDQDFYFDTATTSGEMNFRVGGSTTQFKVDNSGIGITGSITVSGTVDGVDVAALSSSVSAKLSNVVDDTTPQLGGNLDCNNKVVTLNDSTGSDNNRFKIGNGGDLQIFHNGNHSIIQETGTGDLELCTNTRIMLQKDRTEVLAKFIIDGAVELYYDNSKKFETRSGGAAVFGHLELGDNNKVMLGDSNDLEIFHNGTNSFIDNNMGDLYIQTTGSGDDILFESADNISLKVDGSEDGINITGGGAVQLYFGNSEKLATTSTGAVVKGTTFEMQDAGSVTLTLNADTDNSNETHRPTIEFTMDGGTNVMKVGVEGEAGGTYTGSTANTPYIITTTGHGGTNLEFGTNNVRRMLLKHTALVPAANATYDLGETGTRWREIYVENFHTTSTGFEAAGTEFKFSDAANVEVIINADTDNNNEAHHPNLSFRQDGAVEVLQVGCNGDTPIATGGSHNFAYIAQGGHANCGIEFATSGSGSSPIVRMILDASGNLIPKDNDSYDLGSSSKRWRDIYTGDLNLSNEGSSNNVDGTWGSYTIQEGAEDLFLINKRSGKKYKFNLTEVA